MPKITYRKLNFDSKKIDITLESYQHLRNTNLLERDLLESEIHDLLLNSWGSFPANFVRMHILESEKMILARIDKKCVALCNMNIRNVLGFKIHYIEFLLVSKEYQKRGIGTLLSFLIIKNEIIKNILYLLVGKSLEIFFITPNIRVLVHTAKLASFIYPNPYLSDSVGKIPMADDVTWDLANELLKNSDNPSRRLEREGLVLKGSYTGTPWLIYNNDNAPWHTDGKINTFVRKYLGYHSGEDREFMVRARINIISLFRYLFNK